MTTIYIKLIKGTIYTDSRCTTVQCSSLNLPLRKNKPKILAFNHSRKIFAINKCGVAVSGDELMTNYLKKLFALGHNPVNFKVPSNKNIRQISYFEIF